MVETASVVKLFDETVYVVFCGPRVEPRFSNAPTQLAVVAIKSVDSAFAGLFFSALVYVPRRVVQKVGTVFTDFEISHLHFAHVLQRNVKFGAIVVCYCCPSFADVCRAVSFQ